MDFSSNFNSNFKLRTTDPLGLINDKSALYEFLKRLKMEHPRHYFGNLLAESLHNFLQSNSTSLADYFNDRIDLSTVSRQFVRFIFESSTDRQVQTNDIIATIGNNLVHTSDQVVKNILLKSTPKKLLRVFGYGVGDGKYECEIGNFAVQQGLAESFEIFGYDPFAPSNCHATLLPRKTLPLGEPLRSI